MSNLHLDDNEIKRLSEAGLSASNIAIVMKCSKTTILNHLRKINNEPDKIHTDKLSDGNTKKKKIPLEAIIDLYEQGFSDREIAEKLGCSRSNITIRLNKAGYKNRKEKINNIKLRNQISDSLRGTGLGSLNPNYKGEYDTEDLTQVYKNRARGLFRTQAKAKIRNEGCVCTICGLETEAVEVHHIRPFQDILDEFLTDAYSGNLDNFSLELSQYPPFIDNNNLIIVCPTCHKEIHLKDNPELSQYLLESPTTIENINKEPIFIEEVSRVDSSESKCRDT